jgi:hypothetical protein
VSDLTLELLTLCDFALTSKEGKLSLIGIFDRMFVRKTPSTFARFFIVAVLKGKPDSQHQISLSIKDPQGNEVLPKAKEISIKLGSQGRSNIITDIVNMPLPTTGDYRVTLFMKEKKLGEKKLGVINIGPNSTKEEKLPN